LKSLHELLSWQAVSQPFHSMLKATVPLPKVHAFQPAHVVHELTMF